MQKIRTQLGREQQIPLVAKLLLKHPQKIPAQTLGRPVRPTGGHAEACGWLCDAPDEDSAGAAADPPGDIGRPSPGSDPEADSPPIRAPLHLCTESPPFCSKYASFSSKFSTALLGLVGASNT